MAALSPIPEETPVDIGQMLADQICEDSEKEAVTLLGKEEDSIFFQMVKSALMAKSTELSVLERSGAIDKVTRNTRMRQFSQSLLNGLAVVERRRADESSVSLTIDGVDYSSFLEVPEIPELARDDLTQVMNKIKIALNRQLYQATEAERLVLAKSSQQRVKNFLNTLLELLDYTKRVDVNEDKIIVSTTGGRKTKRRKHGKKTRRK